MNMTRDRVQSIVWAIVIVVSAALLLALTFRVNAVKSQVRLTERHIVAIQQEKQALDTEFQTRSNQQQLVAINAVEFGLKAPSAAQYVDGERQLAMLSQPVAPALTPGAPGPVLMASADAAKPAAVKVVAPVRMASAETRSSDHVGASTGSLPRVLGPMADRTLAVGGGTRLLSDHDEVRGRSAKHAATDRVEKPAPGRPPARTAAPSLASGTAAPRKAAAKAPATKHAAPEKLALGDGATRTASRAAKQ